MNEISIILNAGNIASIPVVMGLVSVLKVAFLADRYAPLSAIIFGIGVAFIFPAASFGLTLLAGVTVGLMAAGVYSGTKTVVQG